MFGILLNSSKKKENERNENALEMRENVDPKISQGNLEVRILILLIFSWIETPTEIIEDVYTTEKLVSAVQHGDFPFVETAVERFGISPNLWYVQLFYQLYYISGLKIIQW